MTLPGNVCIRFLNAIQHTEASNRDEMSDLVRKRILYGIQECPTYVTSNITWFDRIVNSTLTGLLFLLDYIILSKLLRYMKHILFLSNMQILGYMLSIIVMITLVLYVYVVYGIKYIRHVTKYFLKYKKS